MAKHTISATALIPAPSDQVYAIIADYRDGHPRILPKPHFVGVVVEEGGVGTGTVIRFQMRLLGRLQTFRAAITEPEPGRVLVETDLQTGAVTTFTVEPRADAQQAAVTIATTTTVRAGLLGRLEAWLATRLLRPIYVRELAQLAAVAAQNENQQTM
ncbi:MAG: SRPBCC family protein [Caldilineaceae bacterium]